MHWSRTNHILCLVWILLGWPSTARPDSFDISISTEKEIKLVWNLPPLAPFLETPVEIDYILQGSTDFQTWTNIESLQVSDPSFEVNKIHLLENEGLGMFFRSQRILAKDSLFLGATDLSNAQFQDTNLAGLDLAFCLLHEADFSQSDLSGVDLFATFGNQTQFIRANLTGVNFSASLLRRCEFQHVDLSGATARFATMTGNNFREADLRFVDFTGTDLFGSDMTNADLRGAIFLEADMTFVRLHGSRMDPLNRMAPKPLLAWQIVNEGRPGADLSNVDLSGMILSHSELRDANLSRANLTGVDFEGTDLRGADLRGTQAALVNLRGSILNDASRLPAPLRITWEIVNRQQDGRQLNNVNLSEAVLSGGHMEGFSLVGANLSQAVMLGTNLREANLQQANLSNAFLQGADLSFADLTGALLGGAQLTDARFENTIMPNGTIRNSE